MKSKRDEAVVHVFLSLLGVAREVVVDRARARADAYRMAASAEYHQARLFEARSVRIEEAVRSAVLTLVEATGEPQHDPVAGDATTPCAPCEGEHRSAAPHAPTGPRGSDATPAPTRAILHHLSRALWRNEELGRFLTAREPAGAPLVPWRLIRDLVAHAEGVDPGPIPCWPSQMRRAHPKLSVVRTLRPNQAEGDAETEGPDLGGPRPAS